VEGRRSRLICRSRGALLPTNRHSNNRTCRFRGI